MPTHVDADALRPPARLSSAVLFGALAVSSTLMWAQASDMTRAREASQDVVTQRVLQTLATEAGEQFQVPLAIEDHTIIRDVASSMVAREPALAGIVIVLANGETVRVGDSFDSPWTVQVPVLGTQATVDGFLLGAGIPPSGPRKLGHIELYAHDIHLGASIPWTQRISPWVLGMIPLIGLAAALWFRQRLLRLCEISARVSQGDVDHLPVLRGKDELAWAAANLKGVTLDVASRVEHVQGRNAALLRDVTLKEDRLQRIANFASTLVAPLHEQNLWQHVVDSLATECDSTLALLFVQTHGTTDLRLEAAFGIKVSPQPEAWLAELRMAGIHASSTMETVVVLPALPEHHPWMLDRNIPLLGVAALPLKFRGQLEGLVIVAKPQSWSPVDLEFMDDVGAPLAIALANRRAFESTVELARVLEQRNDELLRQKNRLEVVDRMRAQFVANISHELRTPLNAIIGYTELIADECFGPVTEKQVSSLESVLESSQHLLQLVNQVLDLSRAEAGELATDPRDCDVFEVARETARLLRPLTRDRPYDLQVRGRSVKVRTDPERLHQILTNLLSNAIKFTKDGSVGIRVLSEANGGACIVVEDTGIGIDASHLEIVFEAFRQVDGSTTRAHDGAGLGLAISRSLAVALGGSLSVASVVGKGSTFTLLLPKRAPQPSDVRMGEALSRAS